MRRLCALFLMSCLAACAALQDGGMEPAIEEPVVIAPVAPAPAPAPPPIPTFTPPPPPPPPVEQDIVPAPVEPMVSAPSARQDTLLADESSPDAPPLEEMIIEEDTAQAATAAPEAVEEDFFTIRVSFATNRRMSDAANPAPEDLFTSDLGPLSWGQADVSIPAVHQRGVLETPGWLEDALFGMNPARHVVLQAVLPGTEDAVLQALRDDLANAGSNAILVYVHGYATDFEKAARRMAQMKHDLQFSGPAMFFSWPSRGVPAAYPQDSNMVRVTEPSMKQVLRRLADQPADRIVMIAHSMGTQVLSYALADLIEEDPALADRFRAVILAAPDIDERVFNDQLVPAFEALPEPVTLYASSNDAALKASRRFNGYARIGDASEVLRPLDNVVVIDASNVTSDFFGHRYFAENTSILHDIYQKVVEGRQVDARTGLESIVMDTGTIYRITGN